MLLRVRAEISLTVIFFLRRPQIQSCLEGKGCKKKKASVKLLILCVCPLIDVLGQRLFVFENKQTRMLINSSKTSHKRNNKDPSPSMKQNEAHGACAEPTQRGVKKRSRNVTQTQQQRPESPTVTLTRHASKYTVLKLRQCYIPFVSRFGLAVRR